MTLDQELLARLGQRRVLATDLDGTLLRPDLTVSDETRAAIRDAVDQGIHVVYVTGRPPRWMRVVGEETGHAGTAICANGAVRIDLAAERVTHRTVIDSAAAHRVTAGLRERYGSRVHFAMERVAIAPMPTVNSPEEFALESNYRGSLPVPAFAPRMSLADLLALPDPVKLLARMDEGDTDGFLPAALELADGALEVTHSTSEVLLEFGPRGVTKATALADLVASWGLTAEDVVAVGDMPNDVHMLRWAGTGLGVAESHNSVREAADFLVPGPVDDGVGRILRAMLG